LHRERAGNGSISRHDSRGVAADNTTQSCASKDRAPVANGMITDPVATTGPRFEGQTYESADANIVRAIGGIRVSASCRSARRAPSPAPVNGGPGTLHRASFDANPNAVAPPLARRGL